MHQKIIINYKKIIFKLLILIKLMSKITTKMNIRIYKEMRIIYRHNNNNNNK